MSIEQSLRELSQVSSHQFPDSSAKWLLRQREHLQETTQNTELVDMAESIIEISEKRGHQRGKQEGRQEGRQEGLEQGEIHGKQEALLKLLHHRFPPVPDAVITRVRALRSPVELDALFEKGLTAKSLEDIE